MGALVIRRRLESLPYDELQRYWWDVAGFLQNQVDPATGALPVRYAELYERLRAEFERRGMQLSLF